MCVYRQCLNDGDLVSLDDWAEQTLSVIWNNKKKKHTHNILQGSSVPNMYILYSSNQSLVRNDQWLNIHEQPVLHQPDSTQDEVEQCSGNTTLSV